VSVSKKKTMSLDNMVRELAAGLKDTIEATDSSYIERDPEDAFIDLANRFIFRLRDKITIMPWPSREEMIRRSNEEAASRVCSILTEWMRKNGDCSYTTRISLTGKFQISVKTPGMTHTFFGETVQDAYAQFAQAVAFNGGTL
jgi:hypothetical protein